MAIDTINSQTRLPAKGAQQPSIVEHFSIEGLFGYRTIGFDSAFAATIVIARNGTGKTTLLAALDAFLRGQFTRFSGLEFSKINCKFRNFDSLLTISKDEIDALVSITTDPEVAAFAKAWDVDPLVLAEILELDTSKLTHSEISENQALYGIYVKTGYDTVKLKEYLDRLATKLIARVPRLARLRATVRSVLVGYDIVYLPTYRRIELSLPTAEKRGERK